MRSLRAMAAGPILLVLALPALAEPRLLLPTVYLGSGPWQVASGTWLAVVADPPGLVATRVRLDQLTSTGPHFTNIPLALRTTLASRAGHRAPAPRVGHRTRIAARPTIVGCTTLVETPIPRLNCCRLLSASSFPCFTMAFSLLPRRPRIIVPHEFAFALINITATISEPSSIAEVDRCRCPPARGRRPRRPAVATFSRRGHPDV